MHFSRTVVLAIALQFLDVSLSLSGGPVSLDVVLILVFFFF